MKIRRFYSHNMRSALRQVSDTFGDNAAILSSKKVPGGVEVIAALDYDESLIPSSSIDSNEPEVNSHSHQSGVTDGLGQSASSMDYSAANFQNHQGQVLSRQAPSELTMHSGNQPDLRERLGGAGTLVNSANAQTNKVANNSRIPEPKEFQTEAVNNQARQRSYVKEHGEQPAKKKIEWSVDPGLQAMREELGLMRSMMAEQLRGMAWDRFAERDPIKAMVMRRLDKMGLTSEVVNSLMPFINVEQDGECSWQSILALFTRTLPIADQQLLENGGIFALLGPTGVGKTTSIAKLAARFVIKHGAGSVALISTDNYRISAQEQLATFGRILKIPVAKVSEINTLDMLLKKFADKKLVLIDTAGMSSFDASLMKTLSQLNQSKTPINKLLLMAATSQSAVLKQSLSLFSALKPSGVILTKLDEAASLGEILSEVVTANLPIYFTTDGQKIPEDIRVAKSHQLISKAVSLANKYGQESEDWTLAQSMEQALSA